MLWHFSVLFPSQWDLSCQRFLNFHGDARAYTVDLHPGRQLFLRLFLVFPFLQVTWRIWHSVWYPIKRENNTTALQNCSKCFGTARFSRHTLRVLSFFVLPQPWSPWTPSPAHQGLGAASLPPAKLQDSFWVPFSHHLPLCKEPVLRGCCCPTVITQNCSCGRTKA